MNDFLANIGHLWWLIFPIMGVAGGAARRWQVMSRERHQRRLETLRLKSELRTAELQARSLGGGAGTRGLPTRPPAAPASAPSNDVLERLFTEHDEITARWRGCRQTGVSPGTRGVGDVRRNQRRPRDAT